MYSDSGVVTTMCGGVFAIFARSACGVSPVRTKVRIPTSGKLQRAQLFADPHQRASQIAIDVVRQRLQRRDIDDARLVREGAGESVPDQAVDRCEKCRERFSGARRRGDEHVLACLDRWPRVDLRRGWRFECAPKPCGYGWVERVENVHETSEDTPYWMS